MPYFVVWGHLPQPGRPRTVMSDGVPYRDAAEALTAGQRLVPDLCFEVFEAETVNEAVLQGLRRQREFLAAMPPLPPSAPLLAPYRPRRRTTRLRRLRALWRKLWGAGWSLLPQPDGIRRAALPA